METTRARITGTVGELRENVTRAVDWREQVKTHPGAALATAGAVGLLLAYWVRRWIRREGLRKALGV